MRHCNLMLHGNLVGLSGKMMKVTKLYHLSHKPKGNYDPILNRIVVNGIIKIFTVRIV